MRAHEARRGEANSRVLKKAPRWQQLERIGLPEARGLGCLVGLEGSVGEAPGRSEKDQSFSSWEPLPPAGLEDTGVVVGRTGEDLASVSWGLVCPQGQQVAS